MYSKKFIKIKEKQCKNFGTTIDYMSKNKTVIEKSNRLINKFRFS